MYATFNQSNPFTQSLHPIPSHRLKYDLKKSKEDLDKSHAKGEIEFGETSWNGIERVTVDR